MERSYQFSSMGLNDYQWQTKQMEESTGFNSAHSYSGVYPPQHSSQNSQLYPSLSSAQSSHVTPSRGASGQSLSFGSTAQRHEMTLDSEGFNEGLARKFQQLDELWQDTTNKTDFAVEEAVDKAYSKGEFPITYKKLIDCFHKTATPDIRNRNPRAQKLSMLVLVEANHCEDNATFKRCMRCLGHVEHVESGEGLFNRLEYLMGDATARGVFGNTREEATLYASVPFQEEVQQIIDSQRQLDAKNVHYLYDSSRLNVELQHAVPRSGNMTASCTVDDIFTRSANHTEAMSELFRSGHCMQPLSLRQSQGIIRPSQTVLKYIKTSCMDRLYKLKPPSRELILFPEYFKAKGDFNSQVVEMCGKRGFTEESKLRLLALHFQVKILLRDLVHQQDFLEFSWIKNEGQVNTYPEGVTRNKAAKGFEHCKKIRETVAYLQSCLTEIENTACRNNVPLFKFEW